MSRPRNPFRNKWMRRQYDTVMRFYDTRDQVLFHENGKPKGHTGTYTDHFWRGWCGIVDRAWAARKDVKKCISYAYWCAGKNARVEYDEDKTKP